MSLGLSAQRLSPQEELSQCSPPASGQPAEVLCSRRQQQWQAQEHAHDAPLQAERVLPHAPLKGRNLLSQLGAVPQQPTLAGSSLADCPAPG